MALDLALKTGWCRVDPRTNRWNWGWEDLRKGKHELAGDHWVRVERRLDELIAGEQLVVYEHIHFGKHSQAAKINGALTAILLKRCAQHQIDYEGVAPGTLKKFATGHGRAEKWQMVEAARRLFGDVIPHPKPETLTDDEADAIHLARYALEHFMPAGIA